MSAEPSVTKCGFCGRLYKFYPFYAGDQSACPACVREANQNMGEGKSITTTGDLPTGGGEGE